MRCSPLEAPFGARVHLETKAPLTDAEKIELRRLLNEHGLLVIRDGEISSARQIDMLSAIGRIEPDSTGRPMEMEVTNQHDRSTAPEGELVFHYDYAYDPTPIPAISMYGLVVADGATSTLFASSSTVLGRLPGSVVERLREHQAAHACFLYRPDSPEERSVEPSPIVARGEPGWGPDHYWTHHPVIWSNAAGVETLFVCLQHTDRILGMPRAESDELLELLYGALYASDQIYEHRWKPTDLVLWDNLTVQHARPEPNDRPRTLRRFHVSDTDLTEDYLRVGREHGFV
jgi:taurine dioxygenase